MRQVGTGFPVDLFLQLKEAALAEFKKQEPLMREKFSELGLSKEEISLEFQGILSGYEADIKKKLNETLRRKGKEAFDPSVSLLVEEPALQQAETRSMYHAGGSAAMFQPVRETPLTREDMDRKVVDLLAAHARQDAEIRSKYPSGKK